MVEIIELKEIYSNFKIDYLFLNTKTNTMIVMQNDKILKNEVLKIDRKTLTKIVQDYVINWPLKSNKSNKSNILDGQKVELTIYTDTEIIPFRFYNSFPKGYHEFVTTLKEATIYA